MAKKRGGGDLAGLPKGRILAALRDGVYLIDTGKTTRRPVAQAETAAVLLAKLGKALGKPGISKRAVFGNAASARAVYSYSVLPEEPSKLVRESVDGRRTIGRLVNGKFQAIEPV